MLKFMLPQAVLDVIKFTVTPTSARTLTLDGLTAPCSAEVDWGDGAYAPLTSTTALSHTYADTTPRQITIRGTLGGFWNTADSSGKNLVTSLDEISSTSLVTLQRTFLGCTSLATVPPSLLMPNIRNLIATFKDCRSITSELTPLWLTYSATPHTNCYVNCCKSCYGQQGTSCSHRQYVAAVPNQTYFQKYGQSGCPAAKYVPGSPPIPWSDNAPSCPYRLVGDYTIWSSYSCAQSNGGAGCSSYRGHLVLCSPKVSLAGGQNYYTSERPLDFAECKGRNPSAACPNVYSPGTPSRYDCTHFGGTCKASGCTRIYQSGQTAYYRCTRSGGTCQNSSCPYPYFNETSYNTAVANGWA